MFFEIAASTTCGTDGQKGELKPQSANVRFSLDVLRFSKFGASGLIRCSAVDVSRQANSTRREALSKGRESFTPAGGFS